MKQTKTIKDQIIAVCILFAIAIATFAIANPFLKCYYGMFGIDNTPHKTYTLVVSADGIGTDTIPNVCDHWIGGGRGTVRVYYRQHRNGMCGVNSTNNVTSMPKFEKLYE